MVKVQDAFDLIFLNIAYELQYASWKVRKKHYHSHKHKNLYL